MQTEILITDEARREESVNTAAEILKNGGIVAIPTETVYGLAANALNPEAVHKVFAAKGRPNDNPLIVHIADMDMLTPLISELPEKAKLLMSAFWPGPLTVVLPKSDIVPYETTGKLDTVAIRMPSHPIALQIIRASGLPIAAPSANLSGRPSPTTLQHCVNDLMGKVDAIVDGGRCDLGVESTVVDCSVVPARLLRPGAVTVEQVEEIIGKIVVDAAVTHQLEVDAMVHSPGMKYKHYSPKANVYVVKGSLEKFIDFMKDKINPATCSMVFKGEADEVPGKAMEYGAENDHATQAYTLFDELRKMDDMDMKEVYVRCPTTDGIGLAVFNRLIRAAGFKIIEL